MDVLLFTEMRTMYTNASMYMNRSTQSPLTLIYTVYKREKEEEVHCIYEGSGPKSQIIKTPKKKPEKRIPWTILDLLI